MYQHPDGDLYDVSAAQPPGYGGAIWQRDRPPLLFPRVTHWDQIFATWTPDKSASPPPYLVQGLPVEVGRSRRDMEIGPYLVLDLHQVGGRSHTGLWVRAHDEVCRALIERTVCFRGETISYQVIVWSPEKTLVTAQHDQIIGHHWLAVIQSATVPGYQDRPLVGYAPSKLPEAADAPTV